MSTTSEFKRLLFSADTLPILVRVMANSTLLYLPSGKKPSTVNEFYEALQQSAAENCVVGHDFVLGCRVSTVFLGIDHSMGQGPPILYETMVFDAAGSIWMDRAATRDEAIVAHKAAIQWVISGCSNEE